MSILFKKKADLILAPVILAHSRFVLMDFTYVISMDQFSLLIPMPTISFTNIRAVWLPFQHKVKLFFFIISYLFIHKNELNYQS